MNKIKALLILVFVGLMAVAFSSCDFSNDLGSDLQSSTSAHIHKWSDEKIENEPTCTSVGVKAYFCACG